MYHFCNSFALIPANSSSYFVVILGNWYVAWVSNTIMFILGFFFFDTLSNFKTAFDLTCIVRPWAAMALFMRYESVVPTKNDTNSLRVISMSWNRIIQISSNIFICLWKNSARGDSRNPRVKLYKAGMWQRPLRVLLVLLVLSFINVRLGVVFEIPDNNTTKKYVRVAKIPHNLLFAQMFWANVVRSLRSSLMTHSVP